MLDLGLGAALLDALPRSHPCQLVLVGARPEMPGKQPQKQPRAAAGPAARAAALRESSAGAAGCTTARAPAPAGPGGLAWIFCSGVSMHIRRYQREALSAAGSLPCSLC